MASLGELFIQLGVQGDTKELEETNKRMTETVRRAEEVVQVLQEEITYQDKLIEVSEQVTRATEAYNTAQSEQAKAAALEAKQAAEAQKQRLIELKAKKQEAAEAKVALSVNQKALNTKKEQIAALKGIVKGVAGVVAAISGAVYAMHKFTNELVQSNQAMLNLTRTSDISLKTFQKWDSVGKMLGVDNAAQQIESLNEKLFELRLTGEGARGFQLAGINPIGQDADGVLEQLRDRISTLDNTSASYLLKQMGLDPSMLHILRLERSEFEQLGQTVRKYQLTPKQRQDIQQMNIQLQIAAQKIQYLKQRAIMALMPAWVKFVESFARVSEGLAICVKWLTSTKAGFSTLAGVIMTVVIPAIRALYLAISSHPLVALITAALGAIYLLIDDIMAYFNGEGSMLGAFLYFLDEVDEKLNSIDTPQWVKDLLVLFQSGGDMVNTLDKLKNGEEVKVSSGKILEEGISNNLPFLKLFKMPLQAAQLGSSAAEIGRSLFATPAMQQTVNNNSSTSQKSETSIVINNNIQTEYLEPRTFAVDTLRYIDARLIPLGR